MSLHIDLILNHILYSSNCWQMWSYLQCEMWVFPETLTFSKKVIYYTMTTCIRCICSWIYQKKLLSKVHHGKIILSTFRNSSIYDGKRNQQPNTKLLSVIDIYEKSVCTEKHEKHEKLRNRYFTAFSSSSNSSSLSE